QRPALHRRLARLRVRDPRADPRGRHSGRGLRAQRGRLPPLLVRPVTRADRGGDAPDRALPGRPPVTAPACVMCGKYGAGGGDLHIVDLEGSRVFLHEDQFFPGYVLLVLRRHVTELYELSAAERRTLIEEVSRVAEALARVFQPVKMDFVIVDNRVRQI